MATPNPFQGMSPIELRQRFGGFYPPTAPAESPTMTAPDVRTGPQLAQQYPEYYPGGYGPKVPGLPSPTTTPGQFQTPEQLRQAHPEFYDPPTPPSAKAPVSDLPPKWNVPDSFGGVPEVPVNAPPGTPLGEGINIPGGGAALGGALTGVLSGISGIASGESPDVAIAQGIGAGLGGALGTALGGSLGAVGGPVGVFTGGFLGGSFGAAVGGELARNIGQGIHNLFFPPSSIQQGPNDLQPLPQAPTIGRPGELYNVFVTTKGYRTDSFTGTRTPIDYEALGVSGGPFPGPILGATFSPGTGTQEKGVGTGANYVISGSPAQKYITGYFDFGPHINVYESVSIARVVKLNGQEEPMKPLLPGDFKQSDQPYPRMGGLPLFVTIPPMLPQTLPPSLPQSSPAPTVGPKLEPQKAPTIAPSTPSPSTPTPNTPPKEDPNGLPNLNNLPGLLGLPFIPAVMPANKQTPSGTIQLDPGSGGTGTGKPPKAPTNTPCNSPCQRAIEGRIQGVDDKLSKALQQGQGLGQDAALAEILRRLAVLDAKVGAQVPGGISGFLGFFRDAFDKLSEWLHLDRLLNIMTFIVTLQNAYFLTDSLKIVTLQMISDGLNVLGFKDKDGNGLNLNKLLDKTIEDMLKKVLGVDTLEGMKKEWKALSRIYQAGSNIIYAFQNIAWSILNALDIIGSWNAQIGNALKKYGVVGHNAFAWLNPAPNFHNKFFTAVSNALNIVSNIDFVAQSIIQGRDAVDQITKQSEEFSKDFTDLTNPKPPEHKPTATAEAAAVTHSQSPPPTNDDLNNVR